MKFFARPRVSPLTLLAAYLLLMALIAFFENAEWNFVAISICLALLFTAISMMIGNKVRKLGWLWLVELAGIIAVIVGYFVWAISSGVRPLGC